MFVRWLVVLVVAAALAAGVLEYGLAGNGADCRLALPAGLPPDLPLPEPAGLRSARDLGSRGLNLVFETAEPVDAVGRRLRLRLEADGWELLSEALVGSSVFSSYRKGGRRVAFGLSRTGRVTVIGLAYQQLAS